jgi:hypothetical protein
MSGWIVLIALCAVALLVVWAAVIYDRRRRRAATRQSGLGRSGEADLP